MLRRILKERHGINGGESFHIGKYEACLEKDRLYLLVPAGGLEDEYIRELEQLAAHYKKCGDNHVCQFLKTGGGETVIPWGGSRYCTLVVHIRKDRVRTVKQLGRKLAKFHYRGRLVSFPLKKIVQIGRWKSFWETRLEQMEKFWNEKLFTGPENDFEKMFLESFPYYLGLAENGIQYLTDTEIDEKPLFPDGGTVCHRRFHDGSWGGRFYFKNPFDWVFDHCGRDLAEWTRERYFHNIKTYERDVLRFYTDYQNFSPLSPFSWRLIYARLLFPLHFFDCVENYYSAATEQEKHLCHDRLQRYLQYTKEHEQFLGSFFDLLQVPVRAWRITVPEWLKRVKI